MNASAGVCVFMGSTFLLDQTRRAGPDGEHPNGVQKTSQPDADETGRLGRGRVSRPWHAM